MPWQPWEAPFFWGRYSCRYNWNALFLRTGCCPAAEWTRYDNFSPGPGSQDPDAEIVGAQEQRMEGGTALHIDDLPDLVPVDEIQIHIVVDALQGPGISRLHRIQGKIVLADLFHGQRILFL